MHAVGLLDAVARMRQPVGQIAVVGHQDQPFAVQVEPADGEQPSVARRHQVDHPGTARRVAVRRDHAVGLVDGVVNRGFCPASGRPSTRISCRSVSTRVPSSVTTRRSTSTRPARINSSHCRRLPMPAAARTFCRRSPSGRVGALRAGRRGGAGFSTRLWRHRRPSIDVRFQEPREPVEVGVRLDVADHGDQRRRIDQLLERHVVQIELAGRPRPSRRPAASRPAPDTPPRPTGCPA